MADEIDKAQAADASFTEKALAEHYRRGIHNAMRVAPEKCDDCGEPIPEARRKAAPHCYRCIDCQTSFEIHLHGRV